MISRAVSGLLISNDAVVLVGRGGSGGETVWAPPGGKVEPGESLQQAVEREFVEETCLEVEATGLVGYLEICSDAQQFALWVWLVSQVVGVTQNAIAGSDAHGLRIQRTSEIEKLPLAPGVRELFARLGLV
ncbi:MAG: NUDIX domain-containing protein [Acidimicrobiales bacterium]